MRRIAEFAVYITAAIVIVGAAVGYAIYEARTGGSGDLPLGLIWAVTSAAVLLGYLLNRHWAQRHKWTLWSLCLTVLVIHAAIYAFLLPRISPFPLAYGLFVLVAEAAAFAGLFQYFVRDTAR